MKQDWKGFHFHRLHIIWHRHIDANSFCNNFGACPKTAPKLLQKLPQKDQQNSQNVPKESCAIIINGSVILDQPKKVQNSPIGEDHAQEHAIIAAEV